jgi:tripartite-type tricarboxylate transporter receptor subunit TctC
MQSLPAVVQAIVGGQIAALAENVAVVRTGNVRPLVVLAKERSRLLPEVPSAGESNIAYEASAWSGLAAPKGIPAATRAKLERACRAAVSDAGFVQTADKLAIEPMYRSGDEFGAYVRSELARYKDLLPRLGLQPR